MCLISKKTINLISVLTNHNYIQVVIVLETEIALHIPSFDELNYRQTILMQRETMSYNKGFEIKNKGYHKDTGCVDFPESQWASWYKFWIDNKPHCYYAYIVRKRDNQFIGEVNIHLNSENNWYEMGIVIEGKYRGMGYSAEGLKQLLSVAFRVYNAKAVHNSFESNRSIAFKLHVDAGFKIIMSEGRTIDLLITKEEYYNIVEQGLIDGNIIRQ